jgi:hypothetical protein
MVSRMHPEQRKLYLAVMDGMADLAPLLFQINQHDRQIEILQWLIRNRIVGRRLSEFFNGECQRSFLTVISFVVMKLEGEARTRSVRASEFGMVKRP